MRAYRWCHDYFPSGNFQLELLTPKCPKPLEHDYEDFRSRTLCDECLRNGCRYEHEPRSAYGYPSWEERMERALSKRRQKLQQAETQSDRKRAVSEPTPALRKVDLSEVLREPPTPTPDSQRKVAILKARRRSKSANGTIRPQREDDPTKTGDTNIDSHTDTDDDTATVIGPAG
jgi:hypothetical protein